MSFGLMSSSSSVSSIGITSTFANDVCLKFFALNGERRIRRWTPFSLRSHPYADSPLISIVADFRPSSDGDSSRIFVL